MTTSPCKEQGPTEAVSTSSGALCAQGSIITPTELNELKRVFDTLCFYATKDNKPPGKDCGSTTSSSEACSPASSLSQSSPPPPLCPSSFPVIRVQDIAAARRDLGRKVSRKEVQDIMWEVDENMDGVCDWDEFRIMFERNIRDTSGLEPANLYHMVQFMIYDHDGNGKVSIDETMNILYARLGREKMEERINNLFSTDGTPVEEVGHQGGEIDFARYLTVVQAEQLKAFEESELGKIVSAKRDKKQAKNRNSI